jgi:drug/metabolite transporter (DMT)-like permease
VFAHSQREGSLEQPEPSAETAGNAHTPPTGIIKRFWAWIILLCMGVAIGFSVILGKVIVAGGANPFGVAAWTSALAAGFLLAFSAARRRPISLKRNIVWLYAVCGLLGVVIPAISFYYAAYRLPAGVLSITGTVGPILTFLFSVFFGLERFASVRLLGVLFGVLAVALLVVPEASLPDPSAVPWVLLACVPGLCYALENMVLTFRLPDGVSPFTITCGNYLVSSAVLMFVVVATDRFVPLAWPWGAVEWSIAGMAVLNAVGYGLFIYLITYAGAVFATQVAYLTTISGVAWGIVIFDEHHSFWVWLSLACILTGLALIRPRPHSGATE